MISPDLLYDIDLLLKPMYSFGKEWKKKSLMGFVYRC